jgi:hypothetical protein
MKNMVRILVKNSVFAMDAIISAAKTSKSDLIIVGTHGATGLKLFGSTTTELIFNSEIPVLAIPPRYRYRDIATMVYASDLKNVTKELRWITPMAERTKAEIEVLNFHSNGEADESSVTVSSLVKGVKYKKIKIISQKVKAKSSIVEQLKRYLKNRRPGLLILFPETRSLLDKLFIRSKTEALAYQVKVPLLSYLKSSVK